VLCDIEFCADLKLLCVCKDGDTHVGAEDAEEADIGILFNHHCN